MNKTNVENDAVIQNSLAVDDPNSGKTELLNSL